MREVDVLIGFIGLETSHPFSDARSLRSLRPDVDFVISGAAARVAAFVSEHAAARVVTSARDVIDAGPDVVVVSARPTDVAPIVAQLAAARVPAFVNKPAAATSAQLDALVEAVGGAEDLFLTSSVLRFAPRVDAFHVDRDAVLAVSAALRHDVGWWEQSDFAWQDSSAGAGGLIPVIGVHALDILARILGPHLDVDFCAVATRGHTMLTNGDIGQIALSMSGGTRAMMTLIGVSNSERYEFTFHTADGDRRLVLAPDIGEDDPLGYLATATHVIAMAEGVPSPVPLRESIAVLRGVVVAARMARDLTPGK